jgi:hypothetical protein
MHGISSLDLVLIFVVLIPAPARYFESSEFSASVKVSFMHGWLALVQEFSSGSGHHSSDFLCWWYRASMGMVVRWFCVKGVYGCSCRSHDDTASGGFDGLATNDSTHILVVYCVS